MSDLSDSFPVVRARWALLACMGIVSMGFTVLFPLLAPIGREIGLSEFGVTSIIGASSITFFFMTPIWGRLSDRFGRKRIMLVGLFGFSGGTVLFTLVLKAGMQGLLLGAGIYMALILARILMAVLMSASLPTSSAYMADITDAKGRTRGMGATGAAGNIGAMMGPALAGLAVISILTPLWTIALIAFLNGLFVLFFLPESPRQHHSSMSVEPIRFSDQRILPFMVVGVLIFIGNAVVQQTIGFRFQDVLALDAGQTATQVGIAMTLSAAASLIAQIVVVQRINPRPFTLLRLAAPLLAVAFGMMAVFESRELLTTALMLQGFGMGLAAPGIMAGASLSVSAREQGAVAGVASACGPLGATIGPFIGGALYQLYEPLPYAFSSAIYVVLLFAMPWLARRVRVHKEETAL